MKKTQVKIAIGFGAEMIFFVLVGISLVAKSFGYVIVSLMFAIVFAGYVGKLIGEEAVEKYKLENKK